MQPKRTLVVGIGLGALALTLATLSMYQSMTGNPSLWPTASAAGAGLDAQPYIGLEVNYSDGVKRAPDTGQALQVQYQTRRISHDEGEVAGTVENRSSATGFVVMYLNRSALSLSRGEHVTLQATARIQASHRDVQLAVGYHLMSERGQYLTESVPASAQAITGMDGEQVLRADFAPAIDQPAPGKDEVRLVLPRINIYNIPPGARVQFSVRWTPARVTRQPAQASGSVTSWGGGPKVARPGSTFRFGIEGTGASKAGADRRSTLTLVRHAQVVRQWQQPASAWSKNGPVREGWALPLDRDLPPGDYDVVWELDGHPKSRLGTLKVTNDAGMQIGNAFHRYPGPNETLIGPLLVDYQFARSLASDLMYATQWWQGPDQYDWKGVDRWARFHAQKGQRRLLVVFSGSPTWASSAPREPSGMGIPGNAAPPEKSLWPAYGRMVQSTVKRLQGQLMGVECWNEPDLGKFFTGSSTELADLCALVHHHTKMVDPSIPVICPQPSNVNALKLIYSARTSQGRPLHEFCDYVGAHMYGALGDDAQGLPYDQLGITAVVAEMRRAAAAHGITKPMAVTEFGLSVCQPRPTDHHPTPFNRMSEQAAGEALYQSLVSLHAEGVALVGLYSYDEGNDDPHCRPGGSYVRTMNVDDLGRQRPAKPVIDRINQAIKELGAR